jgi:hypothetical protein
MSRLLSERKDIEEVVCYTENRSVGQVELFLPYHQISPEHYQIAGLLTRKRGVDGFPGDL